MAYLQPYISSSAQGKLDLNGAEISFAWQNNVASPDFPSKITTSDVVGSTDFLGWENPKISINGNFDAVDDSTFFSSLKAFAKETGSVVIYDPIFFTAGTQQIQVGSFSCNRRAREGVQATGSDVIKGSLITYSMEATLTE